MVEGWGGMPAGTRRQQWDSRATGVSTGDAAEAVCTAGSRAG